MIGNIMVIKSAISVGNRTRMNTGSNASFTNLVLILIDMNGVVGWLVGWLRVLMVNFCIRRLNRLEQPQICKI